MSQEHQVSKSLEQLAQLSGKYPLQAFIFVREGLQYTIRKLGKNTKYGNNHITGKQLCFGLRDYAINKWGLLALTVLKQWNITSTMDFGKIVFMMIDAGWMAKTDEDKIEDFDNVFDFAIEFNCLSQIDFALQDQDNPNLYL